MVESLWEVMRVLGRYCFVGYHHKTPSQWYCIVVICWSRSIRI